MIAIGILKSIVHDQMACSAFRLRSILSHVSGSVLGSGAGVCRRRSRRGTPRDACQNLSSGDIRKLLLGERQFWSSNARVTLLIHAPASHEREVLLKDVYHMSEAQFRQYWISKVFRQEASSGPKIVYSNEMA